MDRSPVPSRKSDRVGPLLRVSPAVVLAVLTGACSSGPAPTTYDLSAPTSRIGGGSDAQVVVNPPTALQPLSSQQIIVKDASGSVTFLNGGQWADNLPALIQARLINTFENASQLRRVTRPSSGAVADVDLVSDLRSFEVTTPGNEAVVSLAVKIVNDANGRIVNGRIFRARVPVGTVDAPNVTKALDEALSTVMLDIVRWVSSNKLPRRDEPGPTPPPA